MTEHPFTDRRLTELSPTDRAAKLLLAISEIGKLGTAAIDREVGTGYSSNAMVGTLGALAHGDALRPRDLEPIIGVSSATVSRILDQLENRGDIERHTGQSAGDRRATMIRLTERGRDIERRVADAWSSCPEEIATPMKATIDELDGVVDSNERAPTPTLTADQLCTALGRLGILLVDILTSSLDQIETNGALVLCLLHQDEGRIRPVAISTRLGLSSGATSKLLDRLESSGLVERVYGSIPQDRRGAEVVLTRRGRDRLELIAERIDEYSSELLHAFRGLAGLLESVHH